MSVTEKIEELRVIARRVNTLVEELSAAAENGTTSEPAAIYATMAEFARRRRVSVSTVKRWASLGMPIVRMDRVVRIPIAKAETWIANTGAAS